MNLGRLFTKKGPDKSQSGLIMLFSGCTGTALVDWPELIATLSGIVQAGY